MEQSSEFDFIIMLTIFLNAVAIAIETSAEQGTYGDFFVIADLIFFAVYLLEFIFKGKQA